MAEIEEKVVATKVAKKRRIYQVAKEFHVSIESIVEYLQHLGYEVKNQMSPVTPEMYEKLCERYQGEKPAAEKETEQPEIQQRLLEREKKEQERLELIRREIEELAETKPISLEEVQKEAEKMAEARKKREELEKERRKLERKVEAKARKEAEQTESEQKKTEADRKKKVKEAKRLERLLDIETAEPEFEEEEAEVAAEVEEVAEAEGGVAGTEETEVGEGVAAPETEVVTEKPETGEAGVAEKKPEKEGVGEEEKKKKRKRKKKEKTGAEAETKEAAKPKKKRKKDKKRKVSQEDVEAAIRKTMAAMEDKGRPKRRKRSAREESVEVEEPENVIKVSEFISVAELARLMGVEPTDVIKKCMELGLLVSINQRLDMDTIITVADEFGFDVEQEELYGQDILDELEEEEEENEAELVERPPVVTIMGHVDHGKTSLLDYIRKSNIIADEVGGITQHIGAYVVDVNGKKITFLDTPGHEAFTAMRARGAQVTDIVVLVVAADDRVMPQTIEAINHAKAAGVPIIVAINKIDKPNANPDLIKKELAENGVLIEEWGGKYPCVEISAKTGLNVEQLLELLALQAEILELKANPKRLAKGVIIESQLDKGRGPVATVLVQNGTLHIGDPVIVGPVFGKVRAMFDERGKAVNEAGPSIPVQVLGFDEVPQSGDILHAVKSERVAREISNKRKQLKREQDFRRATHITLDEFSKKMREKAVKELKLIVKADVVGSVEALSDALMKLSNEDVTVHVIHKGVGAITETDVLLASASDAIIIGFQIRPNAKAWEVAEREGVDIRTYSIIYDAIDDVKKALEGMLEPEEKEELLGVAEVREVFRIPKVGNVAGCYVQSGRINRNDRVRVVRDGRTIYEGELASLRRFKEDVKEVQAGFECGIGIQGFNDIKVGDTIEAYQIVMIKRKLEA